MVRVLACFAAFVAVVGSAFTSGQQPAEQPPAAIPVPTMSAADAQAFVDAADRHLDYLPGQVIVKFKDGVGTAAQQRALDAVRSRPGVDRLQWMGEFAVLRDPSQPDARILVEQLSAQPEVEYAELNSLRRKSVTPNDTGYQPRQWNLQAIDMPNAWNINPGSTANVIVAVVDT